MIERTYNIPLRKGFINKAMYKKTKKAVDTLRAFLKQHMKSDKILIGKQLNEYLWKDGIKNPPHHVKVTVIKEDDGTVKAELLGFKYEHMTKEQREKHKEKAEKNVEEKKKEAVKKEKKDDKKDTAEEKTLEAAAEETVPEKKPAHKKPAEHKKDVKK